MNKKSMPYHLNTDFSLYANLISYIDSYNGVKLYKVNTPPNLLGIPLTDAHLYFLDEKLITVYLHLENSLRHIETIVQALTGEFGSEGMITKSAFGLKYKWETINEVFALVKDQIHRKFYIYYAIKEYNVF